MRFSVVEDVCEGEKAIDAFREAHKKEKRDFGVALRARAYTIDGSDLTEYRRGYYMDHAAEYQEWLDAHQTIVSES